MQRYFLLTDEGSHKLTKSPQKVIKQIGINGLPHVYKLHYFQIVYGTVINELKETGIIEGGIFTEKELEGARKLKDIMENTIIVSLGEDVLNTFKAELEEGWKVMFAEIEENASDEVNELTDKLIAQHGYTVVEDNIPTLMFP